MLTVVPVAVIWHLAILGRRADSPPPPNAVPA
jgi:hypothetical protein